ncbi:MAG: hypothetical protein KKD63_04225 [Proteobacteria bacterium]|nr:hypothetical protein [Desulfobulbaceae bacterium]MBU4152069.1 hypothetical protein [Pseudomonadota bacterium]MDP2104863.1 hypothetical protein [Desulfobulbaceae bacterium]
MKTTTLWQWLVLFFSVLLFGLVSPTTSHSLEVTVDVAPLIINVGGKSATFVVHTNLPYTLVDPATVVLNGEPIYQWKMDSLGYFDAIILREAIEPSLEIGIKNLFVLEGKTRTEPPELFWGAEEVLVIDQGISPGLLR